MAGALQDLTAEASLSLADSYYVDENYEEAIDVYTAAISVVRESEMALQIRALSHRSATFYQLRRYAEALEDANSSLKLLSTRSEGLRKGEGELINKRVGLAALELKKYAEAKEAFQKAARLASLNSRPEGIYETFIRKCDDNLKAAAVSVPAPSAKKETKPETSTQGTTKTQEKIVKQNLSKTEDGTKEEEKTESKVVGTLQPNSSLGATSSGAANRPSMPKYQYYQSDKFMTISILETKVVEEDIHVNFQPKQLTVILRKGGVDFTVIANTLYTEIVVDKSKIVIKDEKVLIKLKKKDEKYEWHELFGKNEPFKALPKATPKNEAGAPAASKTRPYASHKDWDQIDKDLKEKESKEKPEGDEAMNKFFKQIYSNADEETRRAMVKSYQTSGGTVLSCNWDEVKEKDYEKDRVAPKGMEWKNWEGKKLPMKEDD